MFFFFFKQKAAYEMRISDWSSDVCSSDLEHRPAERPADAGDAADHPSLFADDGGGGPDRKSVVKGKSVSVRVDLGGRRVIKNKSTKHCYIIEIMHNIDRQSLS